MEKWWKWNILYEYEPLKRKNNVETKRTVFPIDSCEFGQFDKCVLVQIELRFGNLTNDIHDWQLFRLAWTTPWQYMLLDYVRAPFLLQTWYMESVHNEEWYQFNYGVSDYNSRYERNTCTRTLMCPMRNPPKRITKYL